MQYKFRFCFVIYPEKKKLSFYKIRLMPLSFKLKELFSLYYLFSGIATMDAQAKKKALYRAKLNAQKQEKRIESPLVR